LHRWRYQRPDVIFIVRAGRTEEYHYLPLAAINSERREINVRVDLNTACIPIGFPHATARVFYLSEMVGPLIYPFRLGIAKVAHEADRDTLGRLSMDAVDHFNGDLHAPRFHLKISRRYRVSIAAMASSGTSGRAMITSDKDNEERAI
jgi:hypothetical protein